MALLIFVLLLFVLLGWSLPAWVWGAVPICVGILMFVGGLLGVIGSFQRSGAIAGFGSVVIAFAGVATIVFGLGMAGHGDFADALLGWLRNADDKTVIIGGLIVGFIAAAFANRRP